MSGNFKNSTNFTYGHHLEDPCDPPYPTPSPLWLGNIIIICSPSATMCGYSSSRDAHKIRMDIWVGEEPWRGLEDRGSYKV
jgi:hypothetical protein